MTQGLVMRIVNVFLGLAIVISSIMVIAQGAESDQQANSFFLVPYNIQSVGDALTDQQCKQQLNHKLEYQIVNDKPVYLTKDSSIISRHYQRLTTTYISQQERLFTGVYQVKKKDQDNVVKQYAAQIAFLLNTDTKSIRGSMYIAGACKANLIGLQEGLDHWFYDPS